MFGWLPPTFIIIQIDPTILKQKRATGSCWVVVLDPSTIVIWLVVVSTPLEKIESQLGWLFPIYGIVKNVPNHQPVISPVLPCSTHQFYRPSSWKQKKPSDVGRHKLLTHLIQQLQRHAPLLYLHGGSENWPHTSIRNGVGKWGMTIQWDAINVQHLIFDRFLVRNCHKTWMSYIFMPSLFGGVCADWIIDVSRNAGPKL